MFRIVKISMLLLLSAVAGLTAAQQPSPLHVEGRHFVNAEGQKVVMHGFAQTYSPWFNEQGSKWTDYNVSACLSYNQDLIDKMIGAGWKMDFIRLHMDPYWSNVPGKQTTGENDISAFNMRRFKNYLESVFVPMAEFCMEKGMYVIMRPPGVCPEKIAVGDDYQNYLLKVWEQVAQHPKLKDNMCVLFELANEPVHITDANGQTAGTEELTRFMQPIVDMMRQHCNNILLIPGLGYQSNYKDFVQFPVVGDNIGYAVHCYPGWYNGGHGDDNVIVNYADFKKGWDDQIAPIANMAPVVVTEMDWAPNKYNASWGKSYTGVAGGQGFGANFKKLADECGNVSNPQVVTMVGGNLRADNLGTTQVVATYTDPQGKAYRFDIDVQVSYFPLSADAFNPSIWETGTFNAANGNLKTGQWGFGGWQYSNGIDLSDYKYLVVQLNRSQSCSASFRLFDVNNYWSDPYMKDFGSATKLVVDLHAMTNDKGRTLDPSHLYIIGIWSNGGGTVSIKDVFLSDDGSNPTGILPVTASREDTPTFDLQGRTMRSEALRSGLYIRNGKKVFIR